eukprot:gnl/MRDRNA2_/MRDRNA2_86358_c0_seq1.p1 gnl/MRDRNA2_/MRDRNA2_86358_c0~~gnl/MRDRNA2_/MRDRNA2_86358_c0_seq1.p1  ORF type:complete len:191 (+),score=6.37 gnl/MRDRNA2_/MRDRNA2_86358_c0_seq1:377-949(+)
MLEGKLMVGMPSKPLLRRACFPADVSRRYQPSFGYGRTHRGATLTGAHGTQSLSYIHRRLVGFCVSHPLSHPVPLPDLIPIASMTARENKVSSIPKKDNDHEVFDNSCIPVSLGQRRHYKCAPNKCTLRIGSLVHSQNEFEECRAYMAPASAMAAAVPLLINFFSLASLRKSSESGHLAIRFSAVTELMT